MRTNRASRCDDFPWSYYISGRFSRRRADDVFQSTVVVGVTKGRVRPVRHITFSRRLANDGERRTDGDGQDRTTTIASSLTARAIDVYTCTYVRGSSDSDVYVCVCRLAVFSSSPNGAFEATNNHMTTITANRRRSVVIIFQLESVAGSRENDARANTFHTGCIH